MASSKMNIWVVDDVFDHGVACRHDQHPVADVALAAVADLARSSSGGTVTYVETL